MGATVAGNASPELKDLEKILSSVGVEMDKAKAEKVLSELKGKSLDELVAAGTEKLATVPSGGAAAAPAAAAAAAGAAPAAAAAPEKKKEKTPEPSSDEDMGFGLFD